MWKMITEKGEQLPELLVVLATTVVLAAILLPAVTSSQGNEVKAASEVQTDYHGVVDGLVRPSARPHDTHSRHADPEIIDSASSLEQASPFMDTEADRQEVNALREMRTTDISYTIP